jgi:uncharacterized YccA/Bax inhibitor family protein
MAEFVKETITTQESAQTTPVATSSSMSPAKASNSQTTEYFIYFIFGLLEVLLAFRLVLKVTGASASSGFVSFIYSLTGLFILPFQGIFRMGIAQGVETTAVFEPSTLVALIVYIILAWGIVQLLRLLSREQQRS